ncbi:MAG: FAD-dependent oxidoreductase [Leptospiraceae bacterium]|nr:FAD-dependent oxidoreductase [Leptospiraceae bacterium]MCP5495079.1 FAD-dependent oxidoreductase [Leptospiraceae bacterium]
MSENVPRKNQIERLGKVVFDCLIIGGGATGSGTAHDAALRGLNVALIESVDFSAGTSSRSTKLIHGGVRYLGQFHFGLIREALRERKRLLNNAPHLVKPLKFVLPTYKLFEKSYYTIGLTMYDVLAGQSGLPNHRMLSKNDVVNDFPAINKNKLTGGVSYYDAQFNDSRLNVILAKSAEMAGACVCNKVKLESLIKENGKIIGAKVRDILSGKEIEVKAKVVVNTTGVHIDEIRKMDEPNCKPILAPSQGIHLVFPKEKVPCHTAMIIPKTSDGRVVFVLPWEDHVVMGTTDTYIEKISEEPLPLKEEVDFLLKTGNEYLESKLTKDDILSVFSGLRPLISLSGDFDTKNISREEMIVVSDSGLVTMGGGKWSTFRQMAEDLTNKLIEVGKLMPIADCSTYDFEFLGKEGYNENLHLTISQTYNISHETSKRLRNYYGGEVFNVLGKQPVEIIQGCSFFMEEAIYAIQSEFALTTLDILGRRLRILFLDLKMAEKMIQPINDTLARELNWSKETKESDLKKAKDLIESLQNTISN